MAVKSTPEGRPKNSRPHCVFATSKDWPRLRAGCDSVEGRDRFAVDRRMREDEGGNQAAEERHQHLIDMASRIRALALAGLDAAH